MHTAAATEAAPPELRWGERTYVMGIVNVTPDSFSGDGLATPERSREEVVAAAVELGRRFVAEGADIVDVGAESTRPAQFYGQHSPPDAATESGRAVPVVEALSRVLGGRALVSIDTYKGAVAAAAVAAGARIVNDVWGARRDPGTADAAAASGAYLVVVHNRERADSAGSVFEEVAAWLRDAVAAAVGRGVPRRRLIVDPGIGFGKTPEQSMELLHRLGELKSAVGGLPLLVGTSRKRFIGEILGGAPPEERLEGTLASVALAVAGGADIVRVHDVAPAVRTVRVADAIIRRR
ncbi:MAG TPA: dihydropteroate synthase [Candidatus Limnocylindria bacterium]|nr:dihydropteroate synthase [Candidatus Limnocylindria bacterium]